MVSLPSPLNLALPLNDEQFFALCQNHPTLRFERNANGELIIMSPTGGLTGDRNADIIYQLCPDFVVELLSPSDNRDQTRQKMEEYLDQGVRLGWLIMPQQQVVEIYRPQHRVEVQQKPTSISGEPVLPQFELDLTEIW